MPAVELSNEVVARMAVAIAVHALHRSHVVNESAVTLNPVSEDQASQVKRGILPYVAEVTAPNDVKYRCMVSVCEGSRVCDVIFTKSWTPGAKEWKAMPLHKPFRHPDAPGEYERMIASV